MPGSRTRRGSAKRPASQSKPGSDPPDGVGDNDQRLKGGDAANDGPSGLEAAVEAQKPAPSKPAVVAKAKGNKRRGTATVATPTSTAAKKNQKAKASSAKSGPTPTAAKKTTHQTDDPAIAEEGCDKEQSQAEAELENGADGSEAVSDKGGEEEGKEDVASPMSVEEKKAPAGRGGRKGKAQPASAVAEKPPRRGSSRAKAAVKYVAEDNDVRTPGDGGVQVFLS